jgi:hypothetical protein
VAPVKSQPTKADIELMWYLDERAGSDEEVRRWFVLARQIKKDRGGKSRSGRPQGDRKSPRDLLALDLARTTQSANRDAPFRDCLKHVIPYFYAPTPAETEKQIIRRLEDLNRSHKKGVYPLYRGVETCVFRAPPWKRRLKLLVLPDQVIELPPDPGPPKGRKPR